ncbi:GTP-binding protein [Pasteurella atlantica]|uniref:GTP-binding protein n=2 Tax=Pasteurellaceae TaxID=712 RepID=A0ACC6HJ60_9PAST|nr:GTP-binding protein [Pasteurella atlantica]MDP8050909.1 GTP-binding protein [Pasteurella atlantica]MDP8104179.1 GTP-binding protein [Pasteurella atlantica]MDP8147565.1 GTP-binding protein [Pasteurella atlantica]
MKILVISGFLGAGKTSFIKEMVKQTGRQFVILENEFGELGLDGELLKQEQSQNKDVDMKVWELTEGCICCSLNLDFSYSVLTIANTLNPDYLLIEPSGVAMPSKILEQLNRIVYEDISLVAPITIVDGRHYQESKQHFPEYFQDQLNTAGTVVVSKSETFSKSDFEAVRSSLKFTNNVEFFDSHYSTWNKENWFSLLEKGIEIQQKENKVKYRFFRQEDAKVDPLENISFSSHNIQNIDQLADRLFWLTTGLCGKIARVKGYAEIADVWMKFDIVESQYTITGCESMPDERIVVIGQQLNRDVIQQLFIS